jgi:hypothetical protein
MEFFYLGSDESYELFCWLTQTRPDTLNRLIESASANETESPKDALALSLEEFVCESIAGCGYADFGAGVIDELEPGDLLAAPLLKCALQRIEFDRVAEAILRKAGRWPPNEEG